MNKFYIELRAFGKHVTLVTTNERSLIVECVSKDEALIAIELVKEFVPEWVAAVEGEGFNEIIIHHYVAAECRKALDGLV